MKSLNEFTGKYFPIILSEKEKFNLTNVADIKIDLSDYQDLKCIY